MLQVAGEKKPQLMELVRFPRARSAVLIPILEKGHAEGAGRGSKERGKVEEE